MVVLSVTYTETADGFGFKGINGSGWGEQNHPLFSPSYGHASPGKIEYPFNHACGTGNAYQSDVAFWVYAGAARSETTAHLGCTSQTGGTPPFVCLGSASCNGTPNPGQASEPANGQDKETAIELVQLIAEVGNTSCEVVDCKGWSDTWISKVLTKIDHAETIGSLATAIAIVPQVGRDLDALKESVRVHGQHSPQNGQLFGSYARTPELFTEL